MEPIYSTVIPLDGDTHYLNHEQIALFKAASLTILEKTGIQLEEPGAVDLLTSHGARIGERGRVHIPATLVERALQTVPKVIPMHNRLGELTMPLVVGNLYFGTGSDTIYTIDPDTGERRNPTTRDVRRIATLCDRLPNISFVMSMGTIWDAPSSENYVLGFANMLRGTVKPIVFTAANKRDLEHIWRIAVAVAGSEELLRQKPFLLNYSEPISPLRFIAESVEKLVFCAQKGIPVTYCPSPNMGAAGPVTMAGAIALANAETLAGLTIAQLTNPGTPYLYGANVSSLEMRTSVTCYGSPEWPLSMGALTEIARSYGLPAWGYSGSTDSKEVDAQAGLEAMLSTYTAFMSRTCLNHDVGYLETGLTSSMEMITMVDEIISMLRFSTAGIQVNENTLALDAIDRVKPGAGFLADPHTMKNWRSSIFLPTVLDRQRFESWEKSGKLNMMQRLNKKVKNILAEHELQPLTDAVESEIAAILKARLHG